jgi:6-phosphogluconolactonase
MRIVTLFLAFLLSSSAFAADVVYVSVAGEKRNAIYSLDANEARLTLAGEMATSGEPGALTTDSKRRFLFAAFRSTGELAAFRIDPKTGKLTHINTVPAGADPAHISTDKAVKHLFTAYYVAGKITVHAIGEDGSISKEPKQTVTTKEKAHAVVLDPDEHALLVPHTGPNVIYAFPWLKKDGELWATNTVFRTEFATPKNTGPRHAIFHPTLEINGGVDATAQVVYVANEQGGSVTMYHAILNPINWLLQAQQTVSTLPADFKGENACAEIRLHPSNRFLYVSNRGHDSIAMFQIDKFTGKLTALGQTATEKTPRSFDLDPSGKFLFAAGESSGKLAGYRVDEATGRLERIATYDIGKTPWWVMAVRLPEK